MTNQFDTDMENKVMTFDLISSSNFRCLTFILHQFLPSSQLEENNQNLQDGISQTRIFKNAVLEQTDTPEKAFASGSTSEGLSVPMVAQKDNISIQEIKEADLDIMIIQSWLDIVSSQMAPMAENHFQVVLEPVKEFPGYVRLLIPDPPYSCLQYVVKLSGRYFLNSEQMKIQFLKMILENDAEENRFIPRVITGPAINCTIKGGDESPMKYLDKEFDLVICYPLQEWPNFAREWLSRQRFYEWPTKLLIEKIKIGGCHVVCVGHPRSDHPEAQFRMSFSLPEKILAHSLNPTQRQTYILLKILQVQCFKEPKVLSTYCLKNLLFWACEETKPSFWKPENLGACLLYLLDRLLLLLSKHTIPHYFLRNNNLIRHVPKDHVRETCRKVSMARKDPLKYIFSFNEMLKFIWGPYYTHIRSCMHILKCIQYAGVDQRVVLSAEIKSLHDLAVAYLEETEEIEKASTPEREFTDIFTKRYNIVMEIAKQGVSLTNKVHGTDMSLEQFLLDFLEDINNIAVQSHFLCYLIDTHPNSEYLPHIYCYLASLYHRVVYKTDDQAEIKDMLYNASGAYATALKHQPCPCFILVEYASFLNQRKKYANAKPLLIKALERFSKNEGTQHYHVYTYNHRETVDGLIDYVIKQRYQFVVTSPILTHFLLVHCHLVLRENNEALHLMYHFRKLCAATAEDAEIHPHAKANAFLLISYCYYQLKRWEVCLKNIAKVVLYVPTHVGAIWMRKWCLHEMQTASGSSLPQESAAPSSLPQESAAPSTLPQESTMPSTLSSALPQECAVLSTMPQTSSVTSGLPQQSDVISILPRETF